MAYKFPDLAAQTFKPPLVATGIDGTAVGNTLLGSWPEDAMPALLLLTLESSSGVVTPPVVSVGTDSPNYTNISAGAFFPVGVIVDEKLVIPADTDIYVRVSVGAIGVGATHLFTVRLFAVPV